MPKRWTPPNENIIKELRGISNRTKQEALTPYIKENEYNGIIIGHVLGLNINDEYIKDGIIDIKKLRPLARLGYMDYSVVDNFFKMNRPN